MNPPCLLFEDDHLLVVNKPAGMNTHSPSPFAGEGLYEWLRDREARWANLAIIHRLDKETSGVMLFSKTPLANRSLTEQFTRRLVKKKYLLLTDRPVPAGKAFVKSALVRTGDKYVSTPPVAGAEIAETVFSPVPGSQQQDTGRCVEAEPLTGRTHQIRVHAADKGFPIMGDVRYGGTPGPRVCLHAAEISFCHPVSGRQVTFRCPPDFQADPKVAMRAAIIDPESTDAYRLIHGASDGWPGWYVDRLGAYLLSQSATKLAPEKIAALSGLVQAFSARGAYHKILSDSSRQTAKEELSPRLVLGSPAPDRFGVAENGLKFELGFGEGYSVGLFLDQRDNRRRLLMRHVSAGFKQLFAAFRPSRVLNAFSYTGAFSVCAAKAGAHTTSLDLSKKYLAWGKTNFIANGLNPSDHDFIFGDVFDWLRRFKKKDNKFDLILLDPPTFSRSKEFGPFRAEKDFGKLVTAALALLDPQGVLFASSNTANWPTEGFLSTVKASIAASKRAVLQEHYVPQPPDFPISRNEPAYLKTYWARLS